MNIQREVIWQLVISLSNDIADTEDEDEESQLLGNVCTRSLSCVQSHPVSNQ
jgi:hypothetical protein